MTFHIKGRISKTYQGKTTRWVWDGNVPLHEWTEEEKRGGAGDENLITWLFEESSFVPCAKLQNGESYSIVTDYLGTPTHAFDCNGAKVWERNLDIYGKIRTGNSTFVPFLYQGQYFDAEIDLCYNRFRYYDPNLGNYISQDPIGLASNELNLYSYVHDLNYWVDPNALSPSFGSGKGSHIAIVNVYDSSGNRISRDVLRSGNMTPAEKALGFPRSTLATHTEARAMKNIPLSEGQRMEIFGMYPPCNSCKGKMNAKAKEVNADITYIWKDKETGEIKRWKAGNH